MLVVRLCCVVALVFTAGCEGYQSDVHKTQPAARYEIVRVDVPSFESHISTIETLKDRQTGICYMVLSGGISVSVVECDRVKAEQ